MTGSLVGKRALIYGGATGIGFGCAEALAREGAQVFLSGRRTERRPSKDEVFVDVKFELMTYVSKTVPLPGVRR